MLDMSSFARDIVDRLHHTASYFPEEFATRLAADLRSIANIDWAKGKDLWIARKRDLVLAYGYQPTTETDEKPFAYAGGLAFIPVHGMLLNRFSGSYSFATGYNFIRSQLFAAQADPDVQGIVFDYNTYGGTAAGCGELSKDMYETRDAKPTLGVIDHSCYSAGMFIGTANHKLIGSPSSGCGSIGCVSMHVDMSEMLKDEGIKITFIKSGKEKTDGNPYEPLSATAKKTIQSSVDYHASAFFEAVERNRGIDESEIRAMQARCYDPPCALENGLIDGIQTPSEAVSSFLNSLNGGFSMTTQGNGTGAAAPAPMTAEQITAAVAAGIASALPTAIAAHDKAKTERRAAIMGCDEAKERQKLAASLADNTTMSPDEAKAILSAAAKELPEKKAGSGFHDRMNTTQNPNVGADAEGNGGDNGDGGGGGGESNEDVAARIQQAYVGSTGNKVVPIKGKAA